MTYAPRLALSVLGLIAVVGSVALAQDDDGQSLRLRGVVLSGTRTSVTESWGTLYFTVANPTPEARTARVAVFYPGRPDVQYGRDVWVPGRAAISAWLPIGPVPEERSTVGREVEILLFDRTDGQDRLVLPPTQERVRNRAFPYRRREITTALVLDFPADDPGIQARAGTAQAEALLFTHVIRQAGALPEHASVVRDGLLPPTPESFDGVDQVILAGNRLANDPPGREALRHWVEHGGHLWVMLDLVDPEVIAPIFGNALPFDVVDRVGLTSVTIHRGRDGSVSTAAREFEKPVDFVRVIPSAAAEVAFTVNGWPAAFTVPVVRGRVTFTALGPRGWHRPRADKDGRSPYEHHSELPVALPPLEDLAVKFRPRTGPPAITADDLRLLLMDEIGYAVVSRRTAAAVLGGFVLTLIALGIGLRWSGRPELIGWLAPVAAVGAAVLFVVLGEVSRRAVPPTAAVAELVEVVPASDELAANGLFAVYQPESGPAAIATDQGALVDLDQQGLEGQTRRRIQTDRGAWHWDNLSLPAGVRAGPFRYTGRAEGMRALARFGPNGVEGRFLPGSFGNAGDALITSAGREFLAVTLGADGALAASALDVLPTGQFLPGAVLTDKQQRRQAVYRQLLGDKVPHHMEGRDLLMAWAEPRDLPFVVPDGARRAGTALVVVPLEFERPAAGMRVTIPRSFIPFRRPGEGALLMPTLEATMPIEQRLRFQLPASVLPLTVEKAALVVKIRAPSRRLVVSGLADGQQVQLFDGDSPTDPLRLEITDGRLLRPDPNGGLHLVLAVGQSTGTPDAKWVIESVGLDVVGRVADGR